MKILVAADGSVYTKRMLAYIAAHDEWLGSRHQYTVIHCVSPLPHRAAAFVDLALVREYYKDDAEAVLGPIRAFFAMQGIHAALVHRIGAPAVNIAKLAQRGKFDLLIIGSQGHGALRGLVLGSVATGVLSLCSTPVLVIR
jgi:nucleotide-binding universal stress UspA family protein